MVKRILFFFLIFAILSYSASATEALIYKNSACGHCIGYLDGLKDKLQEKGFTITEKDVINSIENRKELENFNQKYGIPFDLRSHITTIINNDLVFEGHIPLTLLQQLFDEYKDNNFPKILLYNDLMTEEIDYYIVMEEDKQVKQCEANKKITECSQTKPREQKWWEKTTFTIVLFTGLVAGIHPCTIAVLLFFIAFLFTIQRTRLNIFKVGASYILGVFLAYLLIGLGIFKAIIFTEPHLAAKIAALLVLILGIINLKQYFFPNKWINLGIPHTSKQTITNLIEKASIPAALILGIFVGICSFGCTAGIYLSILGLLLTEKTTGFLYLVLYNIMFILPLIIILILSSNKRSVAKLEKWNASEKKYVKLVSGIIMLLLGLYILYITYMP